MSDPFLVPCDGCQRHVRSSERACPFCGASIKAPSVAPALPDRTLSRAALFVFATAAASCSSNPPPQPATPTPGISPIAVEDAGSTTGPVPPSMVTADPANPDAATVVSPPMMVAMYGAPAAPREEDAGPPAATGDAGGPAAVADAGRPSTTPSRPPRRPGSIQVRYGAPPPPDDSEFC